MPDRTAADVRLGDLVHRDGGHHPCRDAGALESVLEREAVHDRCQHPDVVAGRAVHPPRGWCETAEDVAATDDDADLDAEAVDLRDLASDEGAHGRVHAVLAVAEERLARQLEEDPPIAQRTGARRGGGATASVAGGHISSPSAYRVNRRTRMFSPIVEIFSVMSSRTVRSSSRNGWSRRHACEYHFFSCPSTICGRMFSGFFWTDSSASSSACLAARSSGGIRS